MGPRAGDKRRLPNEDLPAFAADWIAINQDARHAEVVQRPSADRNQSADHRAVRPAYRARRTGADTAVPDWKTVMLREPSVTCPLRGIDELLASTPIDACSSASVPLGPERVVSVRLVWINGYNPRSPSTRRGTTGRGERRLPAAGTVITDGALNTHAGTSSVYSSDSRAIGRLGGDAEGEPARRGIGVPEMTPDARSNARPGGRNPGLDREGARRWARAVGECLAIRRADRGGRQRDRRDRRRRALRQRKVDAGHRQHPRPESACRSGDRSGRRDSPCSWSLRLKPASAFVDATKVPVGSISVKCPVQSDTAVPARAPSVVLHDRTPTPETGAGENPGAVPRSPWTTPDTVDPWPEIEVHGCRVGAGRHRDGRPLERITVRARLVLVDLVHEAGGVDRAQVERAGIGARRASRCHPGRWSSSRASRRWPCKSRPSRPRAGAPPLRTIPMIACDGSAEKSIPALLSPSATVTGVPDVTAQPLHG